MKLLILCFAFSGVGNAQETSVTDTIIKTYQTIDSTLDEVRAKVDIVDEELIKDDYFLPNEQVRIPDILDSPYLRQLPLSQRSKLRDDESFWYANHVFEKAAPKKKNDKRSVFEHPAFDLFLWTIIIGGFITFIIIYLVNSNAGIFRRTKSINLQDSEIITEDIFEINYQKEIDKATAAGNYRLAIRMMFLRVIRDLSQKQLIQYKPDRTNFDYLLQLNRGQWYQDFFRLTRNYEYSWYGQFDLDMDKFTLIRNDFEQFQRKLN